MHRYFTIKEHAPDILFKMDSYDPLRVVEFEPNTLQLPNLPPIEITLAQNEKDGCVVIRLTDQGGGKYL